MQLLFDLLPVILFFVAYKFSGIYTATIVAIIASIIQVVISRLRNGKFENMQIFTLIILVVMGGLTIGLQNEQFIKWKPTLVNWGFAIAIYIFTIVQRRPAIEKLMGKKIQLPINIWYQLNNAWAIFFILLGALNLWVAYQFSTETWVNFKLFGLMGITLFFVLIQGVYLSKHMKTEE